MRKAIVLAILVLVPTISADLPDFWTIEVEDSLGNPIPNCQTWVSEPWSGVVSSSPISTMFQPHASCDGYVVMWHEPVNSTQGLVVLTAHPIIEDLFSVEGAHTIQAIGSDWQIQVENGSVDAPAIPVIITGEGGSEVRISQALITIPGSTNTYNLSEYNGSNVTVKAIHTGTGQIVEWSDGNLTVGEYGAGWSARLFVDGLVRGQGIWPPTVDWIWQQLNSTQTPGVATIEFLDDLVPNLSMNASWSAQHRFNTGLGLPFIPGVEAGIESQTNRFLSGDVSRLENLLESMAYSDGMESLCCEIDQNNVDFSEVIFTADIDFSTGEWGWFESGNLQFNRSHLDLMRIEVPFNNDIRQMTTLNFKTNGNWQFLSSPLEGWVSGIPSDFNLLRNQVSISGMYTITVALNQPPVISGPEGYSLEWQNEEYEFNPIISDAALSTHDCEWNIGGLSDNSSVNLSSFDAGSNLSVNLSCWDEGGAYGWWNGTYILDQGTPWINASDEIQDIPPGEFYWDLIVGDDVDQDLRVFWTSNKSLDWWYTGDYLQTSFNVDSSVNTINDNISERHKERGLVEYWLAANVSDDVGHYVLGNWTIRLTDAAGPVIIHNLEIDVNGTWQPVNTIRIGDQLRLNLTESFDDHSAIEDVKFEISLGDEILAADLSWEQAQLWQVPVLEVGYHLFNIVGIDSEGNRAGALVGIGVNPLMSRSLEITKVVFTGEELEPGKNQFWVTITNNGATGTPFTLCSLEKCIDSEVSGSSFSQIGMTDIPLNVELGWFETFTVELTYPDDNNETVTIEHVSKFSAGAGIGGFELIFLGVVSAFVINWLIQRKQPRF